MHIKRTRQKVKRAIFSVAPVLAVAALAFSFSVSYAAKPASTGFNEFGYNYNARVFSGRADGVDKVLDNKVWGASGYENDHLVMKWNKAWDDCNAAGNNDPAVCSGAWENNEWNGAVPGGSGEVWHYKIVWVGDYTQDSSLLPEGAYGLWNSYAVISDHGVANGVRTVLAHATPNGYGSYK